MQLVCEIHHCETKYGCYAPFPSIDFLHQRKFMMPGLMVPQAMLQSPSPAPNSGPGSLFCSLAGHRVCCGSTSTYTEHPNYLISLPHSQTNKTIFITPCGALPHQLHDGSNGDGDVLS